MAGAGVKVELSFEVGERKISEIIQSSSLLGYVAHFFLFIYEMDIMDAQHYDVI